MLQPAEGQSQDSREKKMSKLKISSKPYYKTILSVPLYGQENIYSLP
jgi:hypothetical protein